MSRLFQLVVEGIDDAHVIRNLLWHYEVKNTQIVRSAKEPVPEKTIAIQQFGGKSNLLEKIPSILKQSEVKQVGIVIDADNDLNETWQSVLRRIRLQGEIEGRVSLENAGIIANLNRLNQPPIQIGIWIMPNNRNSGGLEEFFYKLIETNDALWTHAQTIVAQLPERRFQPAHLTKIEVATWLAWQDKQRRLGEAVSKGEYLDFEGEECRHFLKWIQQLYAGIL
jgi:hypothetical protein